MYILQHLTKSIINQDAEILNTPNEIIKINYCVCVCVCVPMPTHWTIMCFGFRTRQIDGVECGLFSNHAPLGQTTLRVG